MPISQYSKAPVFVSNYTADMALLQRHDKEIQRINQDYALAGETIVKFKNNIDIIKADSKAYFDSKYKSAVDSFGEELDLTKRNQRYKIEGMLGNIIEDPIIKGALNSTKNIRTLMSTRAKMNADPKYMSLRKPEDEYQDQKAIDSYLNNKDLSASFNQTSPTITMDADKHYNTLIKDIPFEDKVDSNGVVNVFSKVKTAERITNTLFSEMTSNPGVVAAERNKFDYLYKTPEQKEAYAKAALENKNAQVKQITDQINQLAGWFSVNKDNDPDVSAAQYSQLKQREAALQAQKNLLSNPTSDPFDLYLLNKSMKAGNAQQATKDLKVMLDPQKKYFTEVGFKNRDFDYKQKQDAFNNNLKTKEYERRVNKDALDAELQSRKLTGESGVSNTDPNSFAKDEDLIPVRNVESYKTDQNNLARENVTIGNNILQNVLNRPGTELNKKYNEFVRKGLITFDKGKFNILSPNGLKQIAALKQSIIDESIGKEMPDTTREFIKEFNKLEDNMKQYRMNENLYNLAKKKSGYSGEENWLNDNFLKSGDFKNFETLNKSYFEKRDQHTMIPIKSITEDTSGKDFKNLRTNLKEFIDKNGLITATGQRFRTPNTGNNQLLSGNDAMSQVTYDSIDWDKSIESIVIRQGKPQMKLRLHPKSEKEGVKNNTLFENKIAYVDLPPAAADEALKAAGSNVTVQKLAQSSSLWAQLSANKDLTIKEAQAIITDPRSPFGTPVTTIGGIGAKYAVTMRPDRSFNVSINMGKDLYLEDKIVSNPDEYIEWMQSSAEYIKQSSKTDGTYTLDSFKKKLVQLSNRYGK